MPMTIERMNGMREKRREEKRREKVTSRPLGKTLGTEREKIELVNRFDNRWQSKDNEFNISMKPNQSKSHEETLEKMFEIFIGENFKINQRNSNRFSMINNNKLEEKMKK